MVYTLLKKEFTLELRRKSVIAGIGLYLFSLTFICYISFSLRQNSLNEATWSALFWLTILFSCINSVGKSFIGERQGTFIYLYSVASPQQIILSKIFYNAILCIVLSSAGYLLFTMFLKNPLQDHYAFFLTTILASTGLATTLTLISGIAAKASNSNILMAVLSFPVVISILLMAIKATKNALDGLGFDSSQEELLNLSAINLIAAALAYLLFPYIWRS